MEQGASYGQAFVRCCQRGKRVACDLIGRHSLPFRGFFYLCRRRNQRQPRHHSNSPILLTPKTSDVLCDFLARPGSLSSLIVKNAGLSNLAGVAIMAAIGKNTTLKTLDLSGNDIGGVSDLLATHHHGQGALVGSLTATTYTVALYCTVA